MTDTIRVFPVSSGDQLLNELTTSGYEVLGPTITDGAITFGPVGSFEDLPRGVADRQMPGRYELGDGDETSYFGYAVGPHSLKTHLHPSRSPVWDIARDEDGSLRVSRREIEGRRLAVLGARPCEVAALHKQDRVLIGGPHGDRTYASNRADLFVIAVNCNSPAGTCFCAAMGTGPTVDDGFDIALTELPDPDGSRFVALAGSVRGAAMLDAIPTEPASSEQVTAADALGRRARNRMRAEIDLAAAGVRLQDRLEDHRWDEIAQRCLACGNCTHVCPTCFCTDLVDTTSLLGGVSHRERVWDSCFNQTFSQLGSGPVRSSIGSRYRQWLVHKFATWHDQFGETGCVGCGRCVTWCPVGIDVRAEVARIGGRQR